MKPKLITSILLGSLFPWPYFLLITVGPIRSYDEAGKEIVGPGGLAGFIEFEGIADSLLIYSKAAAVSALVVFVICSIYEVVSKKCATKP
ncbi:hypothetical protein A3762_01915 [Oleiphilus sp. HI0125]|uniref:hypothetical protein n=1 Tax=Oleiphilus sp. HI0125 TaxID=1822266 RepID=UPI0007C2E9B8|nr:hypothetical protein [Oleiphilus sp. HI0125]KZZ62858.1 hypothetical protein A3762_01915 [Oleiphilus sp. HI0125]